MKKILIAFLSAFFITNLCFASFSKNDVGTSGAQFLKLGAGARASAMGDAFSAIAEDSTAIYWNPAGLAKMEKRSLSLMHSIWFDNMYYDWASFAINTNFGTLGIGAQYFSYGSIKKIDAFGTQISEFDPSDLAVNLSYAKELLGICLGLNAKYISSKIENTATAYAFDFGTRFNLTENNFPIAIVAQNIGTKLKYVEDEENLPLNFRLGCGFRFSSEWLIALDINSPVDNEINVCSGVEYKHETDDDVFISVRAGYNTKTKDLPGLKGITAGLGYTFHEYTFDYAFVPFGDFGTIHKLGLSIRF
ncbi:MAG: PorV/PorQ family protein [Elusimicrobia bacterium]|nr:PorV/PorQ family protein [Elusimicrobiota bacterium]